MHTERSRHDILDRQIEADHFPRRMAYADAFTIRAGHDDKLRCDSTSPKDGHFSIPDDRCVSKLRVIDVRNAQLFRGVLSLL